MPAPVARTPLRVCKQAVVEGVLLRLGQLAGGVGVQLALQLGGLWRERHVVNKPFSKAVHVSKQQYQDGVGVQLALQLGGLCKAVSNSACYFCPSGMSRIQPCLCSCRPTHTATHLDLADLQVLASEGHKLLAADGTAQGRAMGGRRLLACGLPGHCSACDITEHAQQPWFS